MINLAGLYTTDRNKRKKYSIDIASSWEELKPGQFGTAIYLLHVTRHADPEWIRLSLCALLFEKHIPVFSGISNEDRYTLIHGMKDETGAEVFQPVISFFYTEEPPLKNFYPRLKLKKAELLPPAQDLSNIGFGEWCFLDTYHGFYLRSGGDDQWLNKMIAVAYRPADPLANMKSADYSGDMREKFNENLIQQRVDQIKYIRNDEKLAIFQWLTIALRDAKNRVAYVFPKQEQQLDEDGKPIAPEPVNQEESDYGWTDIYADLIGPKFGTSDQLKHTNAFFVLDYLNKEQKNWKEFQAKSPL